MAPATSLARLRKQVLDLVMSDRMKATEASRSLGISRSRLYELRRRYLAYGEAGLLPKPRPAQRPDRRLPEPLVDQIIAYAIHHPTAGPRTIAAALALPRFGGWRVPTAAARTSFAARGCRGPPRGSPPPRRSRRPREGPSPSGRCGSFAPERSPTAASARRSSAGRCSSTRCSLAG
jgi:hypothetical protein